jgi:hypothetical protein
MNRNEYAGAVLTGVMIGMISFPLLYMVGSTLADLDTKAPVSPEPPVSANAEKHGTFAVVSEYKGCDLVQWQYGMLSEYKYFLHCSK